MTKPRAKVDPNKRREDAAQREVSKLHTEIRGIAKMLLGQKIVDEETGAVEPDTQAIGKAGDLLLRVAGQKAENAGLTKRHTAKVEATVTPGQTPDDWMASLGGGKK